MTDTAAKALVRHLIRAQVDEPDHIHLISPLTQSYALLLAAAEELFGQPRADIEKQIKSQRSEVLSYRPLIAQVVRWRDEAERYERALNHIAYECPDNPTGTARAALGGPP